ncbi:Molecular chaperones HSP105/HSP110/SSE1, HSP70 superfamily [Balamuthia mandrillaris]
MFNDEPTTFTPEELTGMLLAHLKETAENALGTLVKDVVLSVPGWFTVAQRKALMDAAHIAQLNPLCLMNELTATALSYGIYKTDLPEKDPLYVMFYDMGDSSTSCSLVAYTKGKLKVVASAHDRSLGGRNFDRALLEHFCKEFSSKYKLDIKSNTRAMVRLEIACERVKRVLSANSQAPLNVESLMEDRDVSSMISREEFEKMVEPLKERIGAPIKNVLQESGISAEQITTIELVGGGSRIPLVGTIVREALGKDWSRTVNAEEIVAKGCALQCAILSPVFKVREFKVEDANYYPINLVWKTLANDSMDTEEPTEIFSKNCTIPNIKRITFPRGKPAELRASYAPTADLGLGTPTALGKWIIPEVPPTESGEPAPVVVKVKLNVHGIFVVEYAQMVETVYEKQPVSSEQQAAPAEGAEPMEEESKAAPTTEAQKDKMEEEKKEGEANKQEASKPKTRTKRTDLKIIAEELGMKAEAIHKAIEEENKRIARDRRVRETAEAKNVVESYVYDTRSSLSGELASFVTESEKASFLALLNETEDWLYGEGENTTKEAYVARFQELKKLGDPIFLRKREAENRPDAVAALKASLEAAKAFAATTDQQYAHIGKEDRDKILNKCSEIEESVFPKLAEQDAAPLTQSPLILSSDILHSKENLERFCRPIMNKPKPAPKKEEPKEEPKKEEAGAKETPMDAEKEAASNETPMDTEKQDEAAKE